MPPIGERVPARELRSLHEAVWSACGMSADDARAPRRQPRRGRPARSLLPRLDPPARIREEADRRGRRSARPAADRPRLRGRAWSWTRGNAMGIVGAEFAMRPGDRASGDDRHRGGRRAREQPLRGDGLPRDDGAAERHDRHRDDERAADDGALGRRRAHPRHRPARRRDPGRRRAADRLRRGVQRGGDGQDPGLPAARRPAPRRLGARSRRPSDERPGRRRRRPADADRRLQGHRPGDGDGDPVLDALRRRLRPRAWAAWTPARSRARTGTSSRRSRCRRSRTRPCSSAGSTPRSGKLGSAGARRGSSASTRPGSSSSSFASGSYARASC